MYGKARRWIKAAYSRWPVTTAAGLVFLYAIGAPLPAPPDRRWPSTHRLPIFFTSERALVEELMPIPRWLPLMGVTLHLSADPWPGSSSVSPNMLLPAFHRDSPTPTSAGGYRVHIPLFPLTVAMVAWAAYLHGHARATRHAGPNICRKCGYPLGSAMGPDGNLREVNCPECGARNARRGMDRGAG